ncbi:unnamed protein product [Zymoseptoria tritici ST99CH_3D7]|uniref:NAD(P)-binding protein n=1 Tax=Zymoseptoria tritici (strain ST99CH_3D7) TaxID=1276538 RepID=A0A1X7RW03_ZYMT9|nr:unnamed protein product [Zymoseptoria tritici ST99CH_3D7]
MSKAIAIIAGVGPGTGAEIAKRFAASYPVVLLARNPSNFEPTAEEINKSGGRAIGISTDVSSQDSLKAAFSKIEQEFSGAPIAAAIFNASSRPMRKPILEFSVEDFETAHGVVAKGAFMFAQHVLPGLVLHASDSSAKYPPTLIFTGATASIKANAQMSVFASAKFAMRALSMSIAREYAPQGVHVAHSIVDGVIDIELTKEWTQGMAPEAKIAADDIAESYWYLHTQSKRCFTNEIDIRPMMEKW